MTVSDIRTGLSTGMDAPPIPRPRDAGPEVSHPRAARPRSEYWDVATASWRSRGPRT